MTNRTKIVLGVCAVLGALTGLCIALLLLTALRGWPPLTPPLAPTLPPFRVEGEPAPIPTATEEPRSTPLPAVTTPRSTPTRTRTRAASVTPAPAGTRVSSTCPQGCTAQQPGCDIKGNIGDKGEKVYHVPGAAGYNQTRIDPAKGERWFCTEPEAVANGWRKSEN